MYKIIAIAFGSCLIVSTAFGQEPEKPIVSQAKQICDAHSAGRVVLSDNAIVACQTGNWPRVTNAGAFYNTGFGAEFNALIRNLSAFTD